MSDTPPPSAWAKFLADLKSIEAWGAVHYVFASVAGAFFLGVLVGFLLFH